MAREIHIRAYEPLWAELQGVLLAALVNGQRPDVHDHSRLLRDIETARDFAWLNGLMWEQQGSRLMESQGLLNNGSQIWKIGYVFFSHEPTVFDDKIHFFLQLPDDFAVPQ